jgi:hypothetical protein
MVMDTDDYVGVGNDPEKDPIAIITPDEPETDQPLDEPLATDRKSAITQQRRLRPVQSEADNLLQMRQ